MKNRMPAGIPTENDYQAVLDSEEFRDLEQFSSHFLAITGKSFREYGRRWVHDPLHQWSRQWEYPFVLSYLVPGLERGGAKRVLDAGSGATFFPYYLQSRYTGVEISCCDQDQSLERLFQKINHSSDSRVDFVAADLRDTPYDADRFDMAYCISVLEHTECYPEIIAELDRIIKPGGTLIITIDVSLNGGRDISPAGAADLMAVLSTRFNTPEELPADLGGLLATPDIFTTLSARKLDKNLLPWHYPALVYRIQSFLSGRGFGPWSPSLTVFCLAMTKPPSGVNGVGLKVIAS